ncbi:unnamed protein product [Meganyctiphanes norvegica]|uniref:Uncharacterized protein n=1 Tax=Meganyctiphanes norvegica TaxID=48144 RepID=A0AAV2RA99_MEGNR
MCIGPQGSENISGQATLCFNGDKSDFHGSITSQDASLYVISGVKCVNTGEEISDNADGIEHDEELYSPAFYNIRIFDCDIGEVYDLQRVRAWSGEFCTFNCKCLSFVPEKIYCGDRAAMMTKQLLGQKMDGSKVLVGNISVRC